MKIKDYTFRNKLIHFIVGLSIAITALLFFKLLNNGFAIQKLEIDIWTICMLIFFAGLSAYNLNKIKIEISELESHDKLSDWTNEYFLKYDAKKIFESNTHIVYQSEKVKKNIIFVTGGEYYTILFSNNNAIITGPSNKKPSFINKQQ